MFLTAGGVVLRVGGVLQHGSLCAREYGLPCVVGVNVDALRPHHGKTVQVNGDEGFVRLL